MWNLLLDLRFGTRMLFKSPVLSVVAAVSLALGIAANTITFSVVNGFLFEPYPYEDQDGLAIVWQVNRTDADDASMTFADYLDFRERSVSFSELSAYRIAPANLTGADEPKQVQLARMVGATFPMLGAETLLGRSFRQEEADSDAPVAVLDYGFFQSQFAGDASVLGKELTLDGESVTVVGVMPETFDLMPANVDVYRPTEFASELENRSTRGLIVMGRLAPDTSLDEADAEVKTIALQLEREYADTNEGYSARAVSLREMFPGPTDSRLVIVLSVVAFFVLLIACANVANLLLARAELRQGEVALRTALGAARARIVRQLLTESVLLALTGGVLGTLLSFYSIPAIASTMPAELPHAFLPRLNGQVLAYTVLVSVIAGLAFGIAPAVHSFSKNLRASLGDSARSGGASRARHRLRNAFAVSQIAISLAMLLSGGSLARIFDRLIHADHGFEVEGLVTAELNLSPDQYANDSELVGFYRQLLPRIREIPGVASVASMTSLPRSRRTSFTQFTVEGQDPVPANERPSVIYQTVNVGYFDALGVGILQGRGFDDSDHEASRNVAVISETLAGRFFGDSSPLGERLVLFDEPREIVGVSVDVFQPRMPERGGSMVPLVYLPWEQQPDRRLSIALRSSGDPQRLQTELREAVYSVRPEQPLGTIQTLRDHIDLELSGPKVISQVLTLFGVIALILSAMGVYGVMAHSVGQRTREIGIRMAMGATRASVVGLITGSGIRLALLGLFCGAPIAWAVMRGIASTFEGFPGLSLSLTAGIVGLLFGVSMLATYLPAWRASKIAPTEALNQ